MTTPLRHWYEDNRARGRASRVLYVSIALTLVLYLVPFGFWVAYPLTLFSTLVHELGHGLTGLATGGTFRELSVFADTSGVTRASAGGGELGKALLAAGGLVGPALVAGVGFAVSGRERGARLFIGALTLGLGAALALFVRNPFGVLYCGFVVATLAWIVVRCSAPTAQISAVFLSVQLSLSVFSRGGYLFTDSATTGAGTLPSDVALIANSLGGPYWMWGIVCGAFSVAVLWGGVAFFLRRITPRPAQAVAKG